jgi:hypothetical protein
MHRGRGACRLGVDALTPQQVSNSPTIEDDPTGNRLVHAAVALARILPPLVRPAAVVRSVYWEEV